MENLEEEEYYYEKRGVIFIVYWYVNKALGQVVEDARFEDEEKAKEHCRILNNG